MRRNLHSIKMITDGYRESKSVSAQKLKSVIVDELLMQLLLKIDNIPTYGNVELRFLRKGLINDVQAKLMKLC